MNKWNSYTELFEELNKSCVYLVMRNYENYGKADWLSVHDDIDFLCEDKDNFCKVIGAKRISDRDSVHMNINVNDYMVRVDIRTIGDYYYDEKWARRMLDKREKYGDFYVMDDINYFYSLIYHEVYHKNELRDDYCDKLSILAKRLNMTFEPQNAKGLVDNYMRTMGYKDTDYRRKKEELFGKNGRKDKNNMQNSSC